jgi:hypothetical protein
MESSVRQPECDEGLIRTLPHIPFSLLNHLRHGRRLTPAKPSSLKGVTWIECRSANGTMSYVGIYSTPLARYLQKIEEIGRGTAQNNRLPTFFPRGPNATRSTVGKVKKETKAMAQTVPSFHVKNLTPRETGRVLFSRIVDCLQWIRSIHR